MRKKILIVGQNDAHLTDFMTEINGIYNQNYTIDNFNLDYSLGPDLYSNRFHIERHFTDFLYHGKFKKIVRYFDLVRSFNDIPNDYDLINVHYVTIDSYFLLNLFIQKGKKLLLTPWGSDVLRIKNKIIIKLLRKLYNQADYVALSKIRFRYDTLKKFKFNAKKIVDLGYGASTIDYISEHQLKQDVAKEKLELKNKFIITCGYNRSRSQNHIDMIIALAKVKNRLPEELILVFPFTYNGSLEPYKSELVTLLNEHDFSYKFFNEYLDSSKMNEIVAATDIFIHLQNTDANSASMQEYLLYKKLVINGSWLKYDHLEQHGLPYYSAVSKIRLDETLEKIVDSNYENLVTGDHIEEIKKFGWKKKIVAWNQFYTQL